ncbi:MAG TPA: response regulator [Rhizomicrobium sp.]|nr:response regulator [Rhizomicrobium sp.]
MQEQQVGDKPRIYVVDDDANFLAALRRFLMTEGYDVAAFDSPATFLAAHDPRAPGCLLLDLKMAEMSGLDVQCRLLADDERRPVIFITGEASVATSVTAMKQGARDYLTKPVEPQLLLTAVREALAEDARMRAARAASADPLESWETAVTEGGDIAVSFVAGSDPAQAAGHHLLCDREAAMEIAKDLLRTVALSDAPAGIETLVQPPPAARRRPELAVFAIREPGPLF